MRNDDRKALFESLLAVVVVLGGRVESSNTTADVRDFGTVDELVPDGFCEWHRLTFTNIQLITNTCLHNVDCLLFNV
jgi:hypothetical protein